MYMVNSRFDTHVICPAYTLERTDIFLLSIIIV